MKSASKTIEVIVSPDGGTRVQTHGFQGSQCQQASRFLERALGRRSGEQLTAEFHQVAVQSNHPTRQQS
jgi:hypothetical protein